MKNADDMDLNEVISVEFILLAFAGMCKGANPKHFPEVSRRHMTFAADSMRNAEHYAWQASRR